MNVDARFSALLPATALLTTFFVASCAREASDAVAEAQATPIDTAIITDIPREPLGEEDLRGLDLQDLSVELPWTENVVSRDPAPSAPRAFVEEVEVSPSDSFDRVAFTFSTSTPFPGYTIRREPVGSSVSCGENDAKLEVDGSEALVVTLQPARIRGEDRQAPSTGIRTLDQTRFADGGLICDDGTRVVWAAGLASGAEVRVLEFRNPPRLVVDVR